MKSRVLPHHTEAESSVLGGLLLRNELIDEVPHLEPRHFYHLPNRSVFEAMRNLQNAGKPIDVVTLEAELKRADKLDSLGGVGYLGELTLRVPTADNVAIYAGMVMEAANARALAAACADLVEQVYEPDLDVSEYVAHAERQVMAMVDQVGRGRGKPNELGDHLRARMKQLSAIEQARSRGEVAITGVTTGVPQLDRVVGGYPLGVVSLIAARPAMGKSAMLLAAAHAITDDDNAGVHVFSLEDSAMTYADRSLSRNSGIALERIRQADFNRQDVSVLMGSMRALSTRSNRFIVDDDPGLSANDIIRRVRQKKKRNRTRAVFVDYLQLVRRRGHDENAELDQIMTAFSNAAKEDEGAIAWIVASQLNRKVEDRVDKRPQLADVRGSGAIEERAKMILGLYRGAYYHSEPMPGIDYDCSCPPRTPSTACTHRPDDFANQIQLCLIKNNNGQTGRVFARWNGPTVEIR